MPARTGFFPRPCRSKDEFEQFARAIEAPLVANMTEFGKSPLLTLEELAELGYSAVLYPVTLLRVAMKASEAALESARRRRHAARHPRPDADPRRAVRPARLQASSKNATERTLTTSDQ